VIKPFCTRILRTNTDFLKDLSEKSVYSQVGWAMRFIVTHQTLSEYHDVNGGQQKEVAYPTWLEPDKQAGITLTANYATINQGEQLVGTKLFQFMVRCFFDG
jgi:hypothetical protein